MKQINVDKLASAIAAMKRCKESGNDYVDTWQDQIDEACEHLPSGSGIDSGVKLLIDECRDQKLVFSFGFHHMNENGYYDGWTDHKLIITPEFGGYKLRITGRDRNMIKDYLYEVFNHLFQISDKFTDPILRS